MDDGVTHGITDSIAGLLGVTRYVFVTAFGDSVTPPYRLQYLEGVSRFWFSQLCILPL